MKKITHFWRLIRSIPPDSLIGLALFAAGLYAYASTLAPTVLEGDAALFQFTPHVLGVTYPTGYPLYILLGKLWLTLLPVGEIAWRMNLLSAVCAALALPLIYGAARRFFSTTSPSARGKEGDRLAARLAALTATLTFATLPTFWRWATEAKIYTLNILLFAAVLYILAQAIRSQKRHSLFAFLLGMQIAVHSTTVLLIPGLALLIWLNLRSFISLKKMLMYAGLLAIPGLLYFYVPLRGEWLLAHYGRTEAISRGLLADFYHSGWSGWVRYFTAADFTGGVVTNWGRVPQQFVAVYLPILIENLRPLGVVLGLTGGLALAVTRPRLFWPLFLLYAAPIPFVLTYGQGEQTAFLMPSFLIFSMLVGYNFVILTRLGSLLMARRPSFFAAGTHLFPVMLFIVLLTGLILPQTQYNLNRLQNKWDRRIYDEWADALAHPLPQGAAMLAHWGDLTSFWYMQHAEDRRPDLRGLYPPTETVVTDYLQTGGDLFIAGPLQGWAAGIEARYQLLPWGRLVRIAPLSAEPSALLPPMSHPFETDFSNQIRLLGANFPVEAVGGAGFPVSLTWQTLTDLPPEVTVSLRLTQGEGIVAQLDDALLSGWFPHESLPAGQRVLSYAPISVPLGTLPGQYRLQLAAYTDYKQPWSLADGAAVLDLGEVTVVLPPADYKIPTGEGMPFAYNFNGELELVDYEYSVSRVGQGKGFGIRLLWQAIAQPVDNYSLRVEIVDAAGQVLRTFDHQPVGGQLPTGSWRPGQFVRDQVNVVIPAGAPVGEKAIRVRLSWLRPNGSRLSARRWLWPTGQSAALDWLRVTEKEDRQFDEPSMQTRLDVSLDNKVRLLGYNSPQHSGPGQLEINQTVCPADTGCPLQLEFYWQSLSDMDALYWVFLHVVNDQGQIVAQHDRVPGIRGKQPTTGWLPGEVVTDPIAINLPADIAPGEYTIRLGMYLPPDGPRLSALDEAGQSIADFVDAGGLVIRHHQE
jgi:hypothetical protein